MKQLDLQIMEQSYILGCPEGGEARLKEAVRRVDEAMCKIRDSGKLRSRERVAVLAALNLAFDHLEAQEAQQQAHTNAVLPEDEQRMQALLARMDAALANGNKKAP